MITINIEFKYKSLWAKKIEEHGLFKWLPLEQHLTDTGNVIRLLWNHWLSSHQKNQIVLSLSKQSEEQALQLVHFLGLIHDIGKATPVFQQKKGYQNSFDLDNELINKLTSEGFKNLDTLILMNPSSSPHALAGQAIIENMGVNRDISSIISGHHGKPTDEDETVNQQITAFPAHYYQSENESDESFINWKKAQENILNWSLNESGFTMIDSLPRIEVQGQVLLSGLLIMADWISSNVNYFPLLEIDGEEIYDQKDRMQKGWLTWYRERVQSFQEGNNKSITDGYKKRFKFNPRPSQEKFSKVVDNIRNPGIIIFEAPMGMGKTEAALFAVEQLGIKLGQFGMFFGLPTQATSDGIFDRIERWIDKLDADTYSDKKSLQLVHGKASLNDTYQELRDRAKTNDELDGSVTADEWFQGKKTAILDDFVVGTIDQFLMLSLKQKHLALRHLGFSKKILILDEIHAYDGYMSQYLKMALQWMGAYKVPVILLSATLPGKQREEFVKDYLFGQNIKWKQVEKPDDLKETTAYPLVTYTDGTQVKQEKEFETQTTHTIKIQLLNEEDLISKTKELLSDGGVVGIMVNTVQRSQEIADLLSEYFGDNYVDLLHSRFLATDRRAKEKDLLSEIGKNGKRPKKKIIIGTQVIEQSLDIDFDILITDIAPMDLLLQRMGRLHRHKDTNRPTKLKEPQVFLLNVSEDYEYEPGSKAIYGQYLLMRTQYFLPETVHLPEDISPLVQKVYGAKEIEWPNHLKNIYIEAHNKDQELIKSKKHRANTYRLGRPSNRSQPNLIGWLKNSTDYLEEAGNAQVRDADPTIEVILVKKTTDGYTFIDGKENIAYEIDKYGVAKRLAQNTITLPRVFSYPNVFDQVIEKLEVMNKKYFANWQQQSWLKGSLGLLLNEDDTVSFNGYILKYDKKLGLIYQKEEEDGTV